MDRDTAFAMAASTAVIAVIVLGFWNLGSPANQRDIGADQRRSEDLQRMARVLHQHYSGPMRLPSSLDEIQPNAPYLSMRDPVTNLPYEFRPLSGAQYELCATFSSDTRNEQNPPDALTWRLFTKHARGRQCFDLDTTRPVYPSP